jgi:membrane protein implicated in regulation of membrane protease activity
MEIVIHDGSMWTWWIVATGLLIAELILPGVFLVWLGIAAALVGAINFFVPITWQFEILIFGALSVAIILIANPWLKRRQEMQSDRPNLNRRMLDYVGKKFILEEPIRNGRGKLKIEDTYWELIGPELPKGAWVLVTGVEGSRLTVEEEAIRL